MSPGFVVLSLLSEFWGPNCCIDRHRGQILYPVSLLVIKAGLPVPHLTFWISSGRDSVMEQWSARHVNKQTNKHCAFQGPLFNYRSRSFNKLINIQSFSSSIFYPYSTPGSNWPSQLDRSWEGGGVHSLALKIITYPSNIYVILILNMNLYWWAS